MKLEDVKEQIDNYFDNVDPNHLLYLYNREQQLKEKIFQLKFYKKRLHLYKSKMKLLREKQISKLEKEIKELS